MSFAVYPQPDACRAWMPTTPLPPSMSPPSPPMVCHMPEGHDGPHSNDRRPTTLSRRWEGDARPPKPVTAPTAEHCTDCGAPIASPDELESGLCLRCLNGPVTAAVPAGDPGALLDRLEELAKAATAGPWDNPYPFTKLIDGPGTSDNLAIVQCDRPADAALIVAAVNALPTLVRLARDGLALREDVTSLAVRFETLGEVLHSVPAAEAYADAGASLRAVVADTSGEQ